MVGKQTRMVLTEGFCDRGGFYGGIFKDDSMPISKAAHRMRLFVQAKV